MGDTFSQLQSAAHAGAFGAGSKANPTPEQIRAGNYAKGTTRLHGMRITIETPMFQSRRGKQDGKPWEVLCMAHYGYINGTRGADGDAVDIFVGPMPESQWVFVVNQVKRDGAFDEHKVMLGFSDEQSARDAYMNSYLKGWTGLGSLTACTIKQFKHWLKAGDLSQPLQPGDLSNDEALSMSDTDTVFVNWLDKQQPEGVSLADVLYDLRKQDPAGLLMDSATLADINEYLGTGDMLDAMVIELQQFERKANQLLVVMQRAAEGVQPTSVEVSKPFKNRGTTQVAMLFAMDDGQSVSVFFHNPDSTPNKLMPGDELVSWKWVLNKKDITITVAPEKGQDLNPREVARRIMKLVQKNSAKFTLANTNKADQDARLEALKADEAAKTTELASLDTQIADLTAKLEAVKATAPAQKPALSAASTILEDYADVAALGTATVSSVGSENVYFEKYGQQYMTKLLNTDDYEGKVGEVVDLSGVVDPHAAPAAPTETLEQVARRLVPDEFKSDIDPEGFTAIAADGYGIRLRPAAGGKSLAAYILKPGVNAQESMGSSTLANGLESAVSTAVSTAMMFITKWRAQAPATEPAPAAEPATTQTFVEWEGLVLEELAERMEIGNGDAEGIAMAQEALVGKLYADKATPADAAAAIQAAATSEPETEEEKAMLAAHLEERAIQAALETPPSAEPAADEDTGEIAPEGRENTVKTAKGTKVSTGFKVIEARNLVISHETDGTPNPDYPAEIQPRDRARTTSQAWVQKTARNLDPDSLGRTQRADSGAPIVGADRVVESGNGRAMAIREAYRLGTADEYREWLEENAEYFGVDVAKIKRMKAPVLVRVRISNVNRVEFAVEANQDDKLAMTATEKARSDAKRLDSAMLAKLADGDLNSAANRDFVAAFLQSLGDAEAAQYLTTEGKPTSGLISRLQAALFAGAYSDDRLLELTADVAKPEITNIVAALNSAAPDFMRAKEHDRIGAETAGGQVVDSVELSLNQEAVNAIISATNVLRQAKESGMGLEEFLRQGDMFGATDPAVAAMALFIQANNRSAKRMGTAFKAMAQFVESENARKQTASLFGDEPASFTDIVAAANRKLEQEYGEGLFTIDQGDMFAAPAPAPAPKPEPAQSPEPDEDEQLQQAKAYLDSLIAGEADMGAPAAVLERLESIYAQYGEAELKELFEEASTAFSNYALKVTAGAF